MATIFGTQGRDTLQGTEFSDVIRGWAFEGDPATDLGDELSGLGGEDRIYGGSGIDALEGGDGDDFLYGQSNGDVVNGGAGNDKAFGGDGKDIVNGGAGNDKVLGDEGADNLGGGAGDDRLSGGEGNDRLSGGSGADTFVFRRGDGEDVIVNLEDGDTIELGSGLGVTSVREALSHATVRNGIAVFHFDGGEELIVGNTDFNQLRDSLFII